MSMDLAAAQSSNRFSGRPSHHDTVPRSDEGAVEEAGFTSRFSLGAFDGGLSSMSDVSSDDESCSSESSESW